jgi:lysophospholipase L1-like esterase
VLTLALVALVQEAAFRVVFPLPEIEGFNRIYCTPLYSAGAEAEKARRGGVANVRIRWECAPDGFAFDHTLNLYGFRGPNFARRPPADRQRIVFIGDSFVEGCGAADDDTLTAHFGRILARQGRPVEAINFGIISTGLLHYYLLARDAVPLVRPGTVFVVCCMNDLPGHPFPQSAAGPGRVFENRNPYVPRLVQVLERQAAGQVVPLCFATGPYPFLEPVPSPGNPLSKEPAPAGVDPDILKAAKEGRCNPYLLGIPEHYADLISMDFSRGAPAEDYLRKIAETCRRNAARLVVVYVPYHAAVNPDYIPAQNQLGGKPLTSLAGPKYKKQQAYLADVTSRLGVPFLDMTGEFTHAERTRGHVYWPFDGHCNRAGYELMAEVCARYLVDGSLPRPVPPGQDPAAKPAPAPLSP